MNDFWSQYWRRGHLTSFGEKYSGNYEGELKKIWLPLFNTLTSGDALLDVCTGNGALVFLAREASSTEKGANITGVDFAELPAAQLERAREQGIQLVEKICAEELPFEDNSMTHVVSQYGLEYTDLASSLSEIGRVIKPQGKFRFVCHYYDSVILKDNRNILKCCKSLSEKGNILDLLTQLVAELQRLNAGNTGPMRGSQNADNLRNKLNEGLAQHLHLYGNAFHDTNFPVLVQSLFNPQNRHKDKNVMINDYVSELEGVLSRLDDLDSAALSAERMVVLEQKCQQHGLIIQDKGPLMQPGNGYIAMVYSGISAS